MLESVRAEVAKGTRTWTAAQLAEWVAAHHGVRLSTDRLRVHLRRAKISWQRTSRTLRHKQDPVEVAERGAVLADAEKKRRPA
jgi:transposase